MQIHNLLSIFELSQSFKTSKFKNLQKNKEITLKYFDNSSTVTCM